MNEHQADKIIDLLANIEKLLQNIEDKLETWQEKDERGGESVRNGLFG
jgi:hypothetical protein